MADVPAYQTTARRQTYRLDKAVRCAANGYGTSRPVVRPGPGTEERAGYRTANASKILIGQVLNYAVEEDIVQGKSGHRHRNPFSAIGQPAEQRKCDEATIREMWSALHSDSGDDGAFSATKLCIKLALLTGARPGDITRAHILT